MKLVETIPETAETAEHYPTNGGSLIEEVDPAQSNLNGHANGKLESTTVSLETQIDPLISKIKSGAEWPDFSREELLELSQRGLATGIMCRWQDKQNIKNGIEPRDPFEFTQAHRDAEKGIRFTPRPLN